MRLVEMIAAINKMMSAGGSGVAFALMTFRLKLLSSGNIFVR